MGTDPDPGGRGAAGPAMGSFQLEDFAAGWIGGELTLDERDPQRWVRFRETSGSERQTGGARRQLGTGHSVPAISARAVRASHCGESPPPGAWGLAGPCRLPVKTP